MNSKTASIKRENNLCVDLKTTCIVRENFTASGVVNDSVPSVYCRSYYLLFSRVWLG